MRKPRMLFTNLFLLSRTGSELHVCEIARAFLSRGWEVTGFALAVGYPIQGLLEEMGVRLISYGEEEQLEPSYDLLFGQHHLVIDYLLTNTETSFKRIVISVLGLGSMEDLPAISQYADMFLFVSEEAAERCAVQMQALGVDKRIFPNYATEPFFEAGRFVRSFPESPEKIAVISNHVPDEVSSLEGFLPKEVSIDFIGFEGQAMEVTPSLLSKYDLVITIGRTVQECFAAGVPCYCYDRFGGPGYIHCDDAEMHAYANFSGRSMPIKRNTEGIWSDICDNYQGAVSNLHNLREEARTKWDFEQHFSSFYESIAELSPSDKAGLYKENGCATDGFRLDLLCHLYKEEVLRSTGLAQLFWENDEGGLEEECSITFRYYYHTWIDAKLVEGVPKGKQAVRFDPDNKPCKVSMCVAGDSEQPEGTDELSCTLYYDFDPIIDLKREPWNSACDFMFMVTPIPDSELDQFFKELSAENASLHLRLETIEKESHSLRWLLRRMKMEIRGRI